MTTAEQVCRQARERFGTVAVAQLATVYAALPDTEPGKASLVATVTPPVALVHIERPLTDTISQVGSTAADLLRINIYDPHCGVGMFLVNAAYQLAGAYAHRQTGSRHRAERLARKALPEIILTCVYGMDSDPLAVDLTRLALSLHTGGRLPPVALRRNIICGDPAAGDEPPAKRERANTVEFIPKLRPAP